VTVVEGERRFAAAPEQLFELLTRPEVIASAIPAVREHRVLDSDHWLAKVRPPLPFAPGVTVRFEVLERRPPEHAALHAHGPGTEVTSHFDLVAADGGTLMRWRTELHFSGVLRRLGGHGLEVVARRHASHTLDAVERAL
jgi:carbon monoxide dehydrogenase subunit G